MDRIARHDDASNVSILNQTVSGKRKTVFIDLKRNRQGVYIKIKERGLQSSTTALSSSVIIPAGHHELRQLRSALDAALDSAEAQVTMRSPSVSNKRKRKQPQEQAVAEEPRFPPSHHAMDQETDSSNGGFAVAAVFVAGMAPETSAPALTRHFETLAFSPAAHAGSVASVQILRQGPSRGSLGCALVRFGSSGSFTRGGSGGGRGGRGGGEEHAAAALVARAIKLVHSTSLHGRRLSVREDSRPRNNSSGEAHHHQQQQELVSPSKRARAATARPAAVVGGISAGGRVVLGFESRATASKEVGGQLVAPTPLGVAVDTENGVTGGRDKEQTPLPRKLSKSQRKRQNKRGREAPTSSLDSAPQATTSAVVVPSRRISGLSTTIVLPSRAATLKASAAPAPASNLFLSEEGAFETAERSHERLQTSAEAAAEPGKDFKKKKKKSKKKRDKEKAARSRDVSGELDEGALGRPAAAVTDDDDSSVSALTLDETARQDRGCPEDGSAVGGGGGGSAGNSRGDSSAGDYAGRDGVEKTNGGLLTSSPHPPHLLHHHHHQAAEDSLQQLWQRELEVSQTAVAAAARATRAGQAATKAAAEATAAAAAVELLAERRRRVEAAAAVATAAAAERTMPRMALMTTETTESSPSTSSSTTTTTTTTSTVKNMMKRRTPDTDVRMDARHDEEGGVATSPAVAFAKRVNNAAAFSTPKLLRRPSSNSSAGISSSSPASSTSSTPISSGSSLPVGLVGRSVSASVAAAAAAASSRASGGASGGRGGGGGGGDGACGGGACGASTGSKVGVAAWMARLHQSASSLQSSSPPSSSSPPQPSATRPTPGNEANLADPLPLAATPGAVAAAATATAAAVLAASESTTARRSGVAQQLEIQVATDASLSASVPSLPPPSLVNSVVVSTESPGVGDGALFVGARRAHELSAGPTVQPGGHRAGAGRELLGEQSTNDVDDDDNDDDCWGRNKEAVVANSSAATPPPCSGDADEPSASAASLVPPASPEPPMKMHLPTATTAATAIGVDPPPPSMRILGHGGGGGATKGAVQFEVRWEVQGEEAEDFWFDREELFAQAQARGALLAYEREHGLEP